MKERSFFYKVLGLKIDPVCSEILQERNFATQQEARTYARDIDPTGRTAMIVRMRRDCLSVTA